MFIGTINKREPSKSVLIETHYVHHLELNNLPRHCFSIIILAEGSLAARIYNVHCQFKAPCVICLNETKDMQLEAEGSSDIRIINFDPSFLNTSMRLATVRSTRYEHLCQQHAFFQLSPFLTTDADKISFGINIDTLHKLEYAFDQLTKNLHEQEGWYWTCRARSYFIDIINILERIYHNYYIEEPYDICMNAAISGEFKILLTYINNHLDEKLTLEALYMRFRINKNQIENMFREFLNTTFYEYVKDRRYEEATYYLRFTKLDGEHIASRIGFSSSQNFCKFFKCVSGKTPNQYRKEMIQKRKQDNELLALIRDRN